jgi:hypothetical protein
LGYILLSLHNFTQRIREAITGDRFLVEFGHWLTEEKVEFIKKNANAGKILI